MCGLVGYMGTSVMNRVKSFVDLLQTDVIRGPHSTGVAFIGRKQGQHRISKEVGAPHRLLSDDRVMKSLNEISLAYIGHNRFATKGEINRKNAHPFRVDHIIGAHNGTLTAWHTLPDGQQFESDSKALINSIAKIGIEKTWAKMYGAAALTWWDSKEKSLNFLRNNQRPLCFAVTKDNRGLFWASERWMLEGVCKRNHVDLREVLTPNPNYHFSFKIGANQELVETTNKLPSYVFRGAGVVTNKGGFTTSDKSQLSMPGIQRVRRLQAKAQPKNTTILGVKKPVKQVPTNFGNKLDEWSMVACSSCLEYIDSTDPTESIQIDAKTFVCQACDKIQQAYGINPQTFTQ